MKVGARGVEEGWDGGKMEILGRERGGERVRGREGRRDREREHKTEKQERTEGQCSKEAVLRLNSDFC